MSAYRRTGVKWEDLSPKFDPPPEVPDCLPDGPLRGNGAHVTCQPFLVCGGCGDRFTEPFAQVVARSTGSPYRCSKCVAKVLYAR
jgi:hypothetical protein